MAKMTDTEKSLVINETVTGRVTKAQSRKKVYLLWMDDYTTPILLAQSIVAPKGYIDDSQFIGKTISVTPTQETTSIDARTGLTRTGFLADIESLQAVAGFIELKMNHAARYQVAAQYSVNAEQES